MAVPVIPQLPPAPNRSDAPVDFSSKADTFVAALPPLVVNINSSLNWMGQTMTTVDGYRQAAAQSATDAAGSASAANGSFQAATAQAGLAQVARTGAEVAAAAASAAASLPGGNNGFALMQAISLSF